MENIIPFPTPETDPLADELDVAAALDELEPRYPGWLYKRVTDPLTGKVTKKLNPPSMPEAGAFDTWATADQSLFMLRVFRYLIDLQFYRQKNAGIWDLFKDGDEMVVSPEPTNQINKLCAMISAIPATVRHAFKTPEEQQAAYCVESWERYLLEKWAEQHRAMGNGSLRHEMIFHAALYGVMIGRVVPDPDDPDLPLKLDLLDPATCFWVPGDKWGLLRMSRVYQEPLGKVIDAYDATGEKKLHQKLVDHYKGAKKDDDPMLDYDREVKVVEVWTRWHRYVSVDGVKVLREAHEYGQVPFRVFLLPGEAGMNSTPETAPSLAGLTRKEIQDGYGSTINTRQWDLAMKGHSFFHAMRNVVRYEEKILGMLMTQIKLDTWPPQVTETPYPDDPDPVDLRPKGHTRRRPGEKTTPVQTNVRGQVVAPVLGRLQQFQQKTVLPDHLFGMVEGSNITGFAESSLIAAAKEVIQPYIDATEGFIAAMLELANYMFHGFGHLYVDDPLGTLSVPGTSRNPTKPVLPPPMPMIPPGPMGGAAGGQAPPMAAPPPPPPPALVNQYGNPMAPPPMMPPLGMPGLPGMPPASYDKFDQPDPPEVEIDRDKLAMVGFKPRVELKKLSWQEMTQVINVIGLAKDKGFISKHTGSEWLGLENPVVEQHIIEFELKKEMQMQMAMAPPMLPPGPPGPGGNSGTPPGIQSVQGDSQPSLAPDGVPGRPRGGEDVGP